MSLYSQLQMAREEVKRLESLIEEDNNKVFNETRNGIIIATDRGREVILFKHQCVSEEYVSCISDRPNNLGYMTYSEVKLGEDRLTNFRVIQGTEKYLKIRNFILSLAKGDE